MRPNQHYFDYLSKVEGSAPLSALRSRPEIKNQVAIRHDVDHNLDIALDFSWYEHQHGHRCTYFLLHDHAYNDDPRFLDKVLQIQDYGHEVGVHLNLIAGWFNQQFDDPADHLHVWLNNLRQAGVDIIGSATHGDKQCYEHGFLNSWFFKQQRKTQSEYTAVTPEGIVDPSGRNQIDYPTSERLVRSDGKELALWQADMADFGLEYEAVDINARYWSDTGKDWHRTGDPASEDLSQGRHQILTHPIHWCSKPRTIFVLSSARSGSKWAAKALAETSAANVVHEWTLNHRQRNSKHVNEKVSTLDSALLENKPEYTVKLMEYSARYHANARVDFIEFNVYLQEHVDALMTVFPEAEIYGLVRDGRHVVPSLLNRQWYASQQTQRHPRNELYQEQGLTQFEKACRYWADSAARISQIAGKLFRLESLTQSPAGLIDFLQALDLPQHPRLVQAVDFKPVDRSSKFKKKPEAYWTKQQRARFIDICGSAQAASNYPSTLKQLAFPSLGMLLKSFGNSPEDTAINEVNEDTTISEVNEAIHLELLAGSHSSHHISESTKDGEQQFAIAPERERAWLLFDGTGGSSWAKLSEQGGLKLDGGAFQLDGQIKFSVSDNLQARVFLLAYDLVSQELVEKKLVTMLLPGWRGRFSEVIFANKWRYCIAVHLQQNRSIIGRDEFLSISRLSLDISTTDSNYLFDQAE